MPISLTEKQKAAVEAVLNLITEKYFSGEIPEDSWKKAIIDCGLRVPWKVFKPYLRDDNSIWYEDFLELCKEANIAHVSNADMDAAANTLIDEMISSDEELEEDQEDDQEETEDTEEIDTTPKKLLKDIGIDKFQYPEIVLESDVEDKYIKSRKRHRIKERDRLNFNNPVYILEVIDSLNESSVIGATLSLVNAWKMRKRALHDHGDTEFEDFEFELETKGAVVIRSSQVKTLRCRIQKFELAR